MSDFAAAKVVGALPATLTPNTLYCVRTGVGFDVYLSDSTGSVAHKANAPTNPLEFGSLAGMYNGLFRNGSGQTGDAQNWNGLTRNASVFPFGTRAAFQYNGSYRVWTSNDLMPVDPMKVYALSCYTKWLSKVTPKVAMYVGFDQYDIDNHAVTAHLAMRIYASDTQLAQDLKPNDTVVYLQDASGWNDSNGYRHQRGFAFYTYKDSTGYLYRREIAPYTRYVTWSSNGWWTNGGATPAVNKTNNTITLTAPWNYPNPDDPQGIWRAGTAVSNSNSGGTYNYRLLSNWRRNQTGETEWKYNSAFAGGSMDLTGNNDGTKLRPGTAKIKMMALLNHPQSGIYGTPNDICMLAGMHLRQTDLTRSMVGLGA